MTTSSKQFVYVSNLPYEAGESIIIDVFSKEGVDVASVELLYKGVDHRRRRSGLAAVQLADSSDAQQACQLLDGKQVLSRPMIVRSDKFVEDQIQYDPMAAHAKPTAPAAAAKTGNGGKHGSSSSASSASTSYTLGSIGTKFTEHRTPGSEHSSYASGEPSFAHLGR